MESKSGDPNSLMGRRTLSPSAMVPQCEAPIMTTFTPEPSGACPTADMEMTSSGDDSANPRKKRNTSWARENGQATAPAIIVGPTGCNRYSKEETTPKLPL